MKCSPDLKFLATLSVDGKICVWDPVKLTEVDQDLVKAKPSKVIKSNNRLLCLAINYLGPDEET